MQENIQTNKLLQQLLDSPTPDQTLADKKKGEKVGIVHEPQIKLETSNDVVVVVPYSLTLNINESRKTLYSISKRGGEQRPRETLQMKEGMQRRQP